MRSFKIKDLVNLSIFFPKDCKFNCPFCQSKQTYNNPNYAPNPELVFEKLTKALRLGVSSFSITGGEPLSDIPLLEKMLKLIHNEAIKAPKVHINTSLPKDTVEDVNKLASLITSIGVSRQDHLNNHPILANIDELRKLKVDFRLSHVITSDKACESFYDQFKDVTNIFILKNDFHKVNQSNLGEIEIPSFLNSSNFKLIEKIQNETNNDWLFEDLNNQNRIKVVRVTETTSINNLVKDVILFQDGVVSYDWIRNNSLPLTIDEEATLFSLI